MESKFSEQESLSIINEMLERARNNFQKGSGNIMIFWGCATAFTSLLVFILLKTLKNPDQAFWAWCLMAIFHVIAFFIERKQQRNLLVKTQIDSIINSIWSGYLLFCLLFLAIVFSFGITIRGGNTVFFTITPIILLALGMAEFITAKACRFRWYFYGAIVMWTGALLCLPVIISGNPDYQFIILAACMLTGFVVTGILQNKAAKNHV